MDRYPSHLKSKINADPAHEAQCIDCILRVDVCPVDAIDVDPGRTGRLLAPDGRALTMILTLQCYRCGTNYEYVGTSPHPGKCQVCGSQCVPPAGSLDVLNSTHWESANGLSKVWVYALDERGRPFEFQVAGKGNRGKLVALRVDGIAVDANVDETFETLPSAVRSELVDAGIERVDANTPKESR